jgi:putative tryptophan/tyrosine transport system substrate-binding protein
MKRRQFMTRLGAAIALPLAAHAQQSKRLRRIGVLMNIAADSPEAPGRVGALAQGLAERGWTIGVNVQVDYRWYAGDADASRKYAEELIALAPNVFLATGTLAATALQRTAGSVPIVFTLVSDPVGAGLVDSPIASVELQEPRGTEGNASQQSTCRAQNRENVTRA